MAITGGDFFCGRFKGVAAIIARECLKNFREGIGLVADSPRAWRERASARATAVEGNVLQFLFACALFDEAFAVAVQAALRIFDRVVFCGLRRARMHTRGSVSWRASDMQKRRTAFCAWPGDGFANAQQR